MVRDKDVVLLRVAATIVVLLLLGGTPSLAQRRGMPAPNTSTSDTNQSPTASSTAGSRRDARMRGLVASLKPWLGIAVKDMPRGSDVQGVQIEAVEAGSPAENAGVRIGDIVTNLAGKDISSSEEFQKMVLRSNIGADYPISVLRDGETVEMTIRPAGRQAAQSSAESTGIVDTPAPRKGPLDINTLKYALIDPKTHVVTFIGKYDPAYATGPIPYPSILKEALDNPYPSFSLEPDEQVRTQIDRADKVIGADIGKMNDPDYCNQWADRLMNLLMYDTSVQADSNRFFANCAAAMGMSGDELKRLYDGAKGKIQISGTETMELAAKLMRGIGAPKAADGLAALMSGGDPIDLLGGMADALGLSSEFQDLQSKGLSDDRFKSEAIILCISEMCRQFEAPESKISSIVSDIRAGRTTDKALTSYMGDQMGEFITSRAGSKMIDGLVLGPAILSKLYNLPVPSVNLVFKDVAPDSQLADVLFKSDYRLKSISAYPDARDQVPGHLTSMEFMQKQAQASDIDQPGGTGAEVGHRLVPGDVEMRVSPNGDVVEFQGSQVKVIGWVIRTVGNNSAADEFIKEFAPKYGDYLTQHYNEYAKAYPEWHKMSEVTKIVALARWAKKNNYTLEVENASDAKITAPKQVPAFWSAVFQITNDKPSLTFLVEGGASFGQDEGEDWVKTQPDVEVTSDVSKQLVASAILGEQSVNAALSGDLDAARDLSEKSALAMTGEIDLTQLPSLDGIPTPSDPAAYAQATGEVINEASDCLKTMDKAQKDLTRAQQLATTSPDEAEKIRQQATQAQDEAQARLKELLGNVSTYRTNPARAGDVVVAIRNNTVVTAPATGSTSSSGTSVAQATTTTPAVAKPEDWSEKCSRLLTELDKVNKQIASTQDVLRKLNASVQSDSKQFAEWEKAADDGFDRCVRIAADTAVDFSAGALAERYETIYDLAKKLPNKPDDLIEKYRYLASLAKRLQEAKATSDYGDLASRENKSDTEIYESLRDGIGQISGLLGLDKTVPGMFWKYGSVAFDMAYNLTELRQGWKNVGTLEENNARYAEAVKKLTTRMQDLIKRQQDLRKRIEAGETVDFK